MRRLEGANVVALAPGGYSAEVLERARSAWGVKNLPFYRDPGNTLFKRFKVGGVPHTVFFDNRGKKKKELKGYGGLEAFRKALEDVGL
jgi:thioredoxin-related protein